MTKLKTNLLCTNSLKRLHSENHLELGSFIHCANMFLLFLIFFSASRHLLMVSLIIITFFHFTETLAYSCTNV